MNDISKFEPYHISNQIKKVFERYFADKLDIKGYDKYIVAESRACEEVDLFVEWLVKKYIEEELKGK